MMGHWQAWRIGVTDLTEVRTLIPRKKINAIIKRLNRHGWMDLIIVYQELVERDDYTRTYGGFKRVV